VRLGVEDQIVDTLQAWADEHRAGPKCFMWAALRKSGRKGNVAVSPGMDIGGQGATAALAGIKDAHITAVVTLLPRLVDAWESLTFRALDSREAALRSEREQSIALATMVAHAESGDDTARWEAIQGIVEELGPLLGPALQSIMRDRGIAPHDPATADTAAAAEYIRGLSPEVRDELVRAILAELGLTDPRQADPEGDDAA
jgi:hypothetical protein